MGLADEGGLMAIRYDREGKYGNHIANHRQIGMAWAGILEAAGWRSREAPLLPPHVVEMMMAAVKILRASLSGKEFDPDDYNDALNYIRMAGEAKEGAQ